MENARQHITKKYSQNAPVVPLEAGKLPPQALEFEQAVLGALMIDSRSVDTVINIIQENTKVFYRPEHREIYTSIINLYRDTKPIDMLTVSNDLRKRGVLDTVGGDMYLVQLTQKVTSAANIEHHARVVQQKYFQRSLIELSSDIITKSYDDSTDVFDLLDEAEGGIFEITNSNIKKSYEKANSLVPQAIKRIQEQAKKEGGISGIPSGFKGVDAVTAGWQNSDLIVIAARPGMGKTAFVVSMARNMAVSRSIPVALFSLEMSSVQLITRMISAETGIPSNILREGSLNKNEWSVLLEKTSDLAKSPIYIDETPGLSLLDFRSKARRLVSQGVKIIFIDYLQLMTVKNSGDKSGNREQEISLISRTLKAVAKDLNIPIIALAQLSRGVEAQTGQKRPMLQHLRESGAIEQDADIVSFIYRPESYNLTEWDDEEHTPCKGQAEFIIAKHRNGNLERVRLRFEGEKALFSDLDTTATAIANSLPSGINSHFDVVDSYHESRINNTATSSSFNPKVSINEAFGDYSSVQTPHDDNDEVPF